MNFAVPYRVKLEPVNKLVGLLFKGYKLDIVVMSHGRIARMKDVSKENLEELWVTGIEFIKCPPYHKVVPLEELS